MKSQKDIERRFFISAGGFFLISLSLLLLPLYGTGETGTQKGIGTLAGILFWAGLLIGSISYFLLYRKYGEILLKRIPKRRIPLCFLIKGNKVAIGADLLFALGAAGMIYCSRVPGENRVIDFLSLFLTVTCFYTHFLATGRAFQYLAKIRKKGVKENEGKTQI